MVVPIHKKGMLIGFKIRTEAGELLPHLYPDKAAAEKRIKQMNFFKHNTPKKNGEPSKTMFHK